MIDTLGKLKDELEKYSEQHYVMFDCLPQVQPTKFDSWRGRYNELSLGYEAVAYGTANMLVGKLLDAVKSTNNRTLEGWKGGNYLMTYNTPLWIDNRGCYTGMQIAGSRFDGMFVLLRVEKKET